LLDRESFPVHVEIVWHKKAALLLILTTARRA
jgi:hypothetical protein